MIVKLGGSRYALLSAICNLMRTPVLLKESD